MHSFVFEGQSKVRLLSLGRLRSMKTKNPSLHPLERKVTTPVSRSRRRHCLRRIHMKASRRPSCRIVRYAFPFTFFSNVVSPPSEHQEATALVAITDEEDEIDSQDDIDDNENMEEGDDEPLFDIARVNNTEIEYEQDPPDVFTSDQWLYEAIMNNSHEGVDVPCTLEVDIGLLIEVLHCNLHLVTGKVVVHVADAFICIWIRIKKGHLITIVAIVANQDIIKVHVQGYNLLITISFAEIDQFPGPIDTSVLYAHDFHRSQLVYAGQKFLNVGSTIGAWVVGQLTPALWNVPRIEINNRRHVLRLYRSELDHQEDYQMHVPDRVLRQFGRVQPIPGPVDALDRVTRRGRGHIDWARYFAHFVQMWHRQRDYIIPPDEETVGIGRVEYMS
ncbi:hypothetical protein Taro_024775 [Colocasia esculenta]|uniref:Uncharacterized protein n=1 Tax=Colocasia esculenta TaxID=4460 RepID=A0A843VIG7_COLES|nr:hypothetical protein [Colocasia esculenta]